MRLRKTLSAIIAFMVVVFAIGCKKENSSNVFVGEYSATKIEFDTKIVTSSSETVDLPAITLKKVSLNLKEGARKDLVTGELSFGDVRGNSYHIEGECSGNEVVFDNFTVTLNDIHTNAGNVNLELVLSCIGTLKFNTLNLVVSYSGEGSITSDGVTKKGNIVEGIFDNVSFVKAIDTNLIIGKWKFVQASEDGVDWENSPAYVYYTFNSDGTVETGLLGTTYIIESNILIMGTGWHLKIISLTNSELIFYDGDSYLKFTKV